MRSRFNYHDFLAYVFPGLLLCLITILVIFARGHYRLFAFIQTFGGFLLLLLFSYLVGHILQAIGAWFEKKVFFPHGYHPGEAFFRPKSGLLQPRDFERLIAKYKEQFGIELTTEELEDPRKREEFFHQIRWGIKSEARAEYLTTLDGYYDLWRGLFISFILCALVTIPIAWGILLVPLKLVFYKKIFMVIWVASIIGIYISARRTQDYMHTYTKEVVNGFLGGK